MARRAIPRVNIGAQLAATLQAAPRQGRINRYPEHTFQVRTRPFGIYPIMCAPVLPGETLKSLMLQYRAVTDPIKNRICGWWHEYAFFYVKHRDLDDRDLLVDLMINPDVDMSSLRINSDATFPYRFDDGVDWANMCLEVVTREFFRDEGKTWTDFELTAGIPAAKLVKRSWTDSLALKTAEEDYDSELLDISAGTAGGGDDKLMVSEIARAYEQYSMLHMHGMVSMDYEDWLETYGVSIPKGEELHKPELIRYIKDWQYPVSAISPTDGSAANAVNWADRATANKPRFFKEPGFIFGVQITRPKTYSSKQTGMMAGAMDSVLSWMPAILQDKPHLSLKQFAAGDGPLQSATSAHTIDVRDLLLYGDQFVNFALTETDANLLALPTNDLTNIEYPTATMVDALFSAASPANQIRSDGVVSMVIAGTQMDHTP